MHSNRPIQAGDRVVKRYGPGRGRTGVVRAVYPPDGLAGRSAFVHFSDGHTQLNLTSDLRRWRRG